MNSQVPSKAGVRSKCLSTLFALKGFLATVNSHMLDEMRVLIKSFPTFFTCVRLFSPRSPLCLMKLYLLHEALGRSGKHANPLSWRVPMPGHHTWVRTVAAVTPSTTLLFLT